MKKISLYSILILLTCVLLSCAEDNESSSSLARLVINEVDASNQVVEIYNGSSAMVDLSTYWFCVNNGGGYLQLNDGTLSISSGSLMLMPGAYIVLDLSSATNLSGKLNIAGGADIGLYSSSSFTSSSAIVDYIKYGSSAPVGRESIAVAAGLWSINEFVDNSGLGAGQSLSRVDQGVRASSWNVATSSLGSEN